MSLFQILLSHLDTNHEAWDSVAWQRMSTSGTASIVIDCLPSCSVMTIHEAADVYASETPRTVRCPSSDDFAIQSHPIQVEVCS